MNRQRTWRRQLSLRLLRLSAALLPPDRFTWAMAMHAEVAHLADDREALGWAAGSVGASLTERLRALRTSGLWSLHSLVLLWIAMFILSSAFNVGMVLVTRLHYQQAASLHLYLSRRRHASATFCTAVALYFGVWLLEFAVPVFVQAISPQRQWRIGICFLLTLGLLVAERSRRTAAAGRPEYELKGG